MGRGRGFKMPDIGARDTKITVRSLPNSGRSAYNQNPDNADVGRLIAQTPIVTELWGEVKEAKDNRGDRLIIAGKILDNRSIIIIVDSESAANININDTVVTDEGAEEYEVVDKFDSNWKYTTELICNFKS